MSWLLVTGQMILIGLLISPMSQLYQGSVIDMFGISLAASSVAVATWAYLSMRPGTFTVLPEPTNNATLTQSGPYQYVRHPMYSAVILGGLGAAICHANTSSWIQLVLLVALLVVKLQREESYLATRYEQYGEYKKQTKALVPRIY